MKGLKRWLSLGVAVVVSVSLFAGCAKDSKISDSTDNAKQTTSAEVGNKISGKLTYASWDYGVNNSGHKEMADAFKKAYPDVEVEVITTSGAGTEYNDKITIMLAAGEDIDIMYGKSLDLYGSFVLKNQALPLDELVARDNFDLKPYGSTIDQLKVDGKLYGLAQRANYWMLFYNKDLFDKAKIPYPTDKLTWQEFREIAKKMTSGEGANKIFGAYVDPTMDMYYLPALSKNIGDLVDGDYKMFKDALTLMNGIQLEDKSAADYATNKSMSAQWRGAFEKGNVAMTCQGSYFINQLVTDKKDGKHNINWSILPLPTWDGKGDITVNSVTPLVINARTKNKEAAWAMAKYLTGKEGSQILASMLMFPAYKDEDVMQSFNSNAGFPKDGINTLKTDKMVLAWPSNKITGLLSKAVEQEVVLCITGNKSIDETIVSMEDRRKEIKEQNK